MERLEGLYTDILQAIGLIETYMLQGRINSLKS
jgi:hypothetical protein